MTHLTAADRVAIHELIALHGHLVDDRRVDDLDQLFTEDAVYDVAALGFGREAGIDSLRRLFAYDGPDNPVAHVVTNTVVYAEADGSVRATSKGLGVAANGTVGAVVYDDRLSRTSAGWRIAERRVRRSASAPGSA
jgi:3-phenylpropionate/cinnamic acid dioxygenase small subunit